MWFDRVFIISEIVENRKEGVRVRVLCYEGGGSSS
jgi:hypothetical protein